MSNRLAVFDCDGTLVDSQALICTAIARGFAACDIPGPGDAAARAIIGLSLAEAMATLHPAGDGRDHAALADAYKASFVELRRRGEDDEPLFDGIATAIADLEARGWLLGVATGKSDRGLAHILAKHGLAGRFVTLQTADRHPSKPHPSMLRQAMADAGVAAAATAMIGDTSYDMGMAKAAGTAAIGVAWGCHAGAELIAAGAHVVAGHPAELVALLEALP